MAAAPKYVEAMKSTVFIFPATGSANADKAKAAMEKEVEARVKALLAEPKAAGKKFEDPDFGPTTDDEYGAKALYGNPPAPPSTVGASSYPKPESIRWDSPVYGDGSADDLLTTTTTASTTADKARTGSDASEEVQEDEQEDYDDAYDEYGGSSSSKSGSSKVWCTEGRLFIGGSGSGDVIQGSLGDCWFLGALSVLATRQKLLEDVFWRGETWKAQGLFVCRFFKDCAWYYVVIDDRIPCRGGSNSAPVFARCRDPNELWVPFIEKAYAKLHGCYKSLIGGSVHAGIGDLTGFAPELMVLQPGHVGFHSQLPREKLWDKLRQYRAWGSLMGCSIRQPQGAEKKQHEAEAACGLRLMHAYSLLDLKEVTLITSGSSKSKCDAPGAVEHPDGSWRVQLVRCRNPWGYGEWEGDWSDVEADETEPETEPAAKTSHRKLYAKAIEAAFSSASCSDVITQSTKDGEFFISFSDWCKHFTHLFIGIDFPSSTHFGQRTDGRWDIDSGGNRQVATFSSNPKFGLDITDDTADVFVSLAVPDARLTHGCDHWNTPLQQTPLSIDIVAEEQLMHPYDKRHVIASSDIKQAPYNFGEAQIGVKLQKGKYLIIPSLYRRGTHGGFYLSVYTSSKATKLQNGVRITAEYEIVQRGGEEMTLQHANAHSECVREKLLREAARLGITTVDIERAFYGQAAVSSMTTLPPAPAATATVASDSKTAATTNSNSSSAVKPVSSSAVKPVSSSAVKPVRAASRLTGTDITRTEFKRHLMALGFNLTDFPDTDFAVLDADNSGAISVDEFVKFFGIGSLIEAQEPVPPLPPPDDLQFQPVDLAGVLTVEIECARGLVYPPKWYNVAAPAAATTNATASTTASTGSSTSSAPQPRSCLRIVKQPRKITNSKRLDMSAPPSTVPDSASSPVNTAAVLAPAPADPPVMARKHSRSRASMSGATAGDSTAAVAAAGALLHDSSGAFAGLEARRSKLLEREKGTSGTTGSTTGSATVRRAAKCCDCGKLGTVQACSRTGCRSGFCAGCWSSLPQGEQMCELCFTASASTHLQAQRRPGSKFNGLNRSSSADATWLRYDSATRSPAILYNLLDTVAAISACRRKPIMSGFAHSDSRSGALSASMSAASTAAAAAASKGAGAAQGNRLSSGHVAPSHSFSMQRRGSVIGGSVAQRSNSSTVTVDGATTASGNGRQRSLQNSLQEEEADEERSLQELYVRLHPIKWVSPEDLHGQFGSSGSSSSSRGKTGVSRVAEWFTFFDKDGDGKISAREFAQTLRELQVNLGAADIAALMARFETNARDGLIDFTEFLDFVSGTSVKDTTTVPLEQVADSLKYALRAAAAAAGAPSIREHGLITVFSSDTAKAESAARALAEHAGILISATDYARLAAAFQCDLAAFIKFVENDSTAGSNTSTASGGRSAAASTGSAAKAVDTVTKVVTVQTVTDLYPLEAKFKQVLLQEDPYVPTVDDDETVTNGTVSKSNGTVALLQTSAAAVSAVDVKSVWAKFAPAVVAAVSLDQFVARSMTLLYDKTSSSSSTTAATTASTAATTAAKTVTDQKDKKDKSDVSDDVFDAEGHVVAGLPVQVALRMLFDKLLKGDARRTEVTYSDVVAFAQARRIDQLETRLRLLFKHEAEALSGYVQYMVTVAADTAGARDALHIRCFDPVSLSHYSLKLPENLNGQKGGLNLTKLAPGQVYTAEYHPEENAAFEKLIQRLRLVQVGERTELTLSEEEPFVQHLRGLLDAAKLPFFTTVDELCLSFAVDSSAVKAMAAAAAAAASAAAGGATGTAASTKSTKAAAPVVDTIAHVQKAVFAGLRSAPQLCAFLSSTYTTLTVTLAAYDSDERRVLQWSELLAHLLNHRNPYATVELLPGPSVSNWPLTREELRAELLAGDAAPRVGHVAGFPDTDGGSDPLWRLVSDLSYTPPQLTARPVVFTDVCKMTVDEQPKYMVVMVRKAQDASLFATAYDPKSACDYVCDGLAGSWSLPGSAFQTSTSASTSGSLTTGASTPGPTSSSTALTTSSTPTATATSAGTVRAASQETRASELDAVIKSGQLVLGPCCTPRLVIRVMNRSTAGDEVLGTCKVSVSEAISNAGIEQTSWTQLTTTTTTTTSSTTSSSSKVKLAGQVRVTVTFRRQTDIDKEAAVLQERALNPGAAVQKRRASLLADTKEAVAELAGRAAGGGDKAVGVDTNNSISAADAAKAQAAGDKLLRKQIKDAEQRVQDRDKDMKALQDAADKTKAEADKLATKNRELQAQLDKAQQQQQQQQRAAATTATANSNSNSAGSNSDAAAALQQKLDKALAAEKRAQAAVDTAAAAHEAELRRAKAAAAAAADAAAAAQHEAAQLRTQLEQARTAAAATTATTTATASTRKVSVAAAPAQAQGAALLTHETAGAAVTAALRGALASRNARHPLRALRRLLGAPASTGATNSSSHEEWSVSYDALCDALEDLQLPLSRAQQEGLCQYLDPEGLGCIQLKHLVQHLDPNAPTQTVGRSVNGQSRSVSPVPNRPISSNGTTTDRHARSQQQQQQQQLPRETEPQRPSGYSSSAATGVHDRRSSPNRAGKGILRQTAPLPHNANSEFTDGGEQQDVSLLPLPQGWKRQYTTTGREYYIDHVNHSTQWDHPLAGVERPRQQKRGKSPNRTVDRNAWS